MREAQQRAVTRARHTAFDLSHVDSAAAGQEARQGRGLHRRTRPGRRGPEPGGITVIVRGDRVCGSGRGDSDCRDRRQSRAAAIQGLHDQGRGVDWPCVCFIDRAAHGRPARQPGDAGFTLIEVLVAFLVIAIIATAGTSLTIRGMRATMDAKQLGQAKNLVNEQVEIMRGLPYFVSTSSNDLLDKYFPNMLATSSPAPACSADAATQATNASTWRGYVADAAQRGPAFEPSVPFFREVVAGTAPRPCVEHSKYA